MKTSKEQLVDSIKRDLNTQYKERSSIWSSICPKSIDVRSYLDNLLKPLVLPYSIDPHDCSSFVQINEYITIEGKYDPNDLKAKFYIVVKCDGDIFTSAIFLDWVPIIYIQEYLPLLKKAVAQLSEFSAKITGRLKAHRKSELLHSVIMSRLQELHAKKISKEIKVCNVRNDSYKVTYPISSFLDIIVTTSFEDYITKIDLLIEKNINALKIKNIKTLKFISVPHYDSRRYSHGRCKGPLWLGEPRKIPYISPDISSAVYELKDNFLTDKLRHALDECGYKYFTDRGLHVILNEKVQIVSNGESYCLSHNNNIVGEKYEMKEEDFIIFLRIIAALPAESIALIANSHSFEHLIENLFGKEICKYLLPEYCCFRYQPASRELSYYYRGHGLKPDFWQTGDIIVFPSNDTKNSIALLLPHQKRYFRNYFTLLTNLDVFHNVLTDKDIYVSGGLTDEDVIHNEDKRAIDITTNYSGAEDLSETFKECKALSINLSDFNTNNAITMREMFMSCTHLSQLDLSTFNTSNVVDMSRMFRRCSHLSQLDLSTFNTSNVVDMSGMFENCTELSQLDLSTFNTSNVTSMNSMFAYCNLSHLDLSGWCVDKLQQKKEMFLCCNKLKTIIMRGCTDVTVNLIKTQLAADGLTSVEIITK